jgi:hypothetical protein
MKIKKEIPTIFFVAAFISLTFFGIAYSSQFQNYSALANSLITLVYVGLTYKILELNKQIRQLPHINPSFIITSKVDEEFISKYPELKQAKKIKQILEEATSSPIEKNYVFVRVENIGEATGIETKLKLKFIKKNIEERETKERDIEFGTIKKNEIKIESLDVFESPSKEDYLQIKDCITEYSTVISKHFEDEPSSDEHAKNVSAIYADDLIKISFKNFSD